jgi:phage gp29-like protein
MAYQLVDHIGRPIQKSALVERIAEPGLTSIRNAWAPTVASGMTPSRLASVLLAAAEGNIHDYLVLAEEMEERDQHYASVLGIRKRAISGVEAIVEEASDNPLDKKIADDVRENLAEHDGFSDLVEDMLDALGKGFSQVELDWGFGKKSWWIEEFIRRDPRFFTFDRDTGQEVRLLDQEDLVNGVELKPFKWISHKAKLKSGLPIRGGLARLVAFGWICKSYTVKDWTAFIETYGLPLRLGRYGPSATKEDVEILFRAVANIGTDAAAVLPESMKIDFEGGDKGTGGDKVFENLARWTDEQTSKAVLGQTMSSDNGSSMAQAQVHNEVRHDVAKADAKSVTTTLMRDLVKPYVDLNYGVQKQYPKLKIIIEEAEDVDMIMRHTAEMVDRGMQIKQSEVRSKLGYSQPDSDDEVLVSSTAQPAAKPDPTPPAKEAVAKNRATEPSADPYAALEELEGELAGDWEEVMTPIISPVLEVLETATSYEEAIATLAEAFPKMDTKALVQSLVKSAVKARALGDGSDG